MFACLATVGVPAPEIPAKCALLGPGPLGAAHRPAFRAALATAGAHVRPEGFPHSLQCSYICQRRIMCSAADATHACGQLEVEAAPRMRLTDCVCLVVLPPLLLLL